MNSLLFGQSILVSFAATNDTLRAALEKTLQPSSTNLFTLGTNMTVSFTLACKAPDRAAAARIFTEVENYFAAPPDYYSLPPWSPTNHLSAPEWEQAAVARATYGRLQKTESEIFTAELDALVNDAIPSNENSQTNSAPSRSVDSRFDSVRKEKFRAIAADPTADSRLVELHLQTPGLLSTNSSPEAVVEEIAKRLGQMPLQDGEPQWEFSRYAISWGEAWKGSRNLRFTNLEFYDLFSGPPALVQWLCDRGCTTFRYAFAVEEDAWDEDAEMADEEGE